MILWHLGKPRRRLTNDGTYTMNMTRKYKSVALAIAGVILMPSCTASTAVSKPQPADSWQIASTQQGKASWYSVRTNGGTRTASGNRLKNGDATAAHKTLPMGSKVRVVNLRNGKSEVVTITDRGPFVRGRVIDVTIGVAQRLGFASRGIAPVKLEVLESKDA
jgi:rare lipoprotein A